MNQSGQQREKGGVFGPLVTPGTSAASFTTSDAIDAFDFLLMAIQVVTTGTITGTWALQASCNYSNRDASTAVWTTLTDSDTADMVAAIAAACSTGNSGAYLADAIPIGARAYRLVYSHGSGTGTVSIYATAKE